MIQLILKKKVDHIREILTALVGKSFNLIMNPLVISDALLCSFHILIFDIVSQYHKQNNVKYKNKP